MAPVNLVCPKQRIIALAALALTLAACGGGGGGGGASPPGPTLDGVSLDAAQTYAIVGIQQSLTLTGHYSDGTTAPLTTGVSWASSAPALVAVDDSGTLAPFASGSARITATDQASGLSAQEDVTARAVVTLEMGKSLPSTGWVDLSDALFRVIGLTPGGMYSPAVLGMTDDVDLAVYSDISLAPESRLCVSGRIGLVAESCVAPASASGELWLVVNGEWTQSGATFNVDAPPADPVTLAATLAFPAAFPYSGAVGAARQYLKVTGLAPGATYQARISNLNADLDLAVYADSFRYAVLCESLQPGTADDSCTVAVPASGELILEVDGETSAAGGPFTLSVSAQ